MEMNKKSIRFYRDHEVRAIWDEEQSQWWFSIVDIVAAVTESPNPRKYWSVLKTRLKKAGNELTTARSQLITIDGQSKKKAYTLMESGVLETMRQGTIKCLQQIQVAPG